MKSILILILSISVCISAFSQQKKIDKSGERKKLTQILASEKSKKQILYIINDTLYDYIENNSIADFSDSLITKRIFQKISIIKLPHDAKSNLLCGNYSQIVVMYAEKAMKPKSTP